MILSHSRNIFRNFRNLKPKLLVFLLILGTTVVIVASDEESNLKDDSISKTNPITSDFNGNAANDKTKNENTKNTINETSQNTVIQPSKSTVTTDISALFSAANTVSNQIVSTSTIGPLSTSTVHSVIEESSPSNSSVSTQSSDAANITNTSTTTVVPPPAEPVLPDKGSAEEEHNSSMSIFFVLCVLAIGILLIHLMLQTNFQYLPESVVIVFLGGAIGMIINLMSHQNIANWRKEEAFSPTAFFLVLLPPIIFESGYNLHKGNFFQNIGSIMVFAIFGTAISAFVIGAGIYLLGLAQVAYKLSFVESFAFGSLISAVDPVATVAIFHALDVDPVLNMLVFGESILNDAISIVLTTSVLESNSAATTGEAIILCLNRFCLMFFASAGIGVVFALISALLLKHFDLRKNPSLEFGLMLVFTYAPYVLAEGIQLSGNLNSFLYSYLIFLFSIKILITVFLYLLNFFISGIMAILFNGIVMSHYTHFNLSTVTQITMQQTMRTLAFIAETCVFAYLGLALFSFRHRV